MHAARGLVRLVHPFPIVLDGLATAAVVLLAGGDGTVALRLGAAMTALQASIGALNDLVDARLDLGRKPGKPIPAGQVSPTIARFVLIGAAGAGFALTVPSGPGLMAIAGLGLAVGYAYDLVAKGTAWSWVPFAIGLPLLPVFAWFGARGSLSPAFGMLLPAAVAAGAALALANARADLERDQSGGVASVATRLGARRAWWLGAALMAGVALLALSSLVLAGSPVQALGAAVLAVVLLGAGVVIGKGASADRRERGWEIQAVAVAALAAAWLWGIGIAS